MNEFIFIILILFYIEESFVIYLHLSKLMFDFQENACRCLARRRFVCVSHTNLPLIHFVDNHLCHFVTTLGQSSIPLSN